MKPCLFLISCGSLLSKEFDIYDAVNMAYEYGFKAVEPYPMGEISKYDLLSASRFGEYCNKKGMEIPCFSMGARLGGADYKDEVQRLRGFIDMANVMGTKMFHHTLVPALRHNTKNMPNLRDIMSQLKNACEEICDYASKYNITCVYENQGFVVNGVNPYQDFFSSIDRYNKGIIADLGNMFFVNEKAQDFVGNFASRIKHVHVKDYLYKSGSGQFPGKGWYSNIKGDYLRGTVVGHGVVDFVQTIKILLKAGYDGYYSFEFEGMENPAEAIKNSLENFKYYHEEAQRQIHLT